MNRDPGRSPEWMPTPEELMGHFSGYIEAMAKHHLPGQDSPAAHAALYERHDLGEGANRQYQIDYEIQTSLGDELSLRFQHTVCDTALDAPVSSISWHTSRGHVYYYASEGLGLMLLFTDGGNAWFKPGPSPDALEACATAAPEMPLGVLDIRADIIRASNGWLEGFLKFPDVAYEAKVRQEVATAMDRYEAGQTMLPTPCEDWLDAEAQLNRLGARHLPEHLMYLFSELSQVTGIMPLSDWVKAQTNTDYRRGLEDAIDE